jgi:RES domain-containing protein
VNLDEAEAPPDLLGISADIPAAVRISRVRPSQLPPDWRHYPAPQALADVGTRWTRAGRTAVLAVPSAVIPSELNYLLNPLHPGFRQVRIGDPQRFDFDSRMWRK